MTFQEYGCLNNKPCRMATQVDWVMSIGKVNSTLPLAENCSQLTLFREGILYSPRVSPSEVTQFWIISSKHMYTQGRKKWTHIHTYEWQW